jgi:hypothetical protein
MCDKEASTIWVTSSVLYDISGPQYFHKYINILSPTRYEVLTVSTAKTAVFVGCKAVHRHYGGRCCLNAIYYRAYRLL